MSKDQELEVKFHIRNLSAVESKLHALVAEKVQERLHEVNLRLDTPELSLTNSLQVLRLRQDSQARVTYKGPGTTQDGVRVRQEFEFVVSDFDSAHNLFKALGYETTMMYEKFRSVYDLGAVHITLDEMPYGDFIEIEGPRPQDIQSIAGKLGISWERRVLDSYTAIFEQLRTVLGFEFRDLSFENFSNLNVSLQKVGILPADEPGEDQ